MRDVRVLLSVYGSCGDAEPVVGPALRAGMRSGRRRGRVRTAHGFAGAAPDRSR
ncbi:hypothetical protein [Streptomyces hygroscopicus]|uniref:hypothetical protein n=1 Tax=Streptomyces hygroscopicus TaxID=1912 RepID=UPI000B12DAD9